MYNCVVVDDEPRVIEVLTNYIATIDELRLLKTYTDSETALTEILAGEMIDFLFLDVEMPKIGGLELAAQIRHKTRKLLFATGHSKFAYDAFELEVDAFLLKPYSLRKFSSIIDRLLYSLQENNTKANEIPKFFLIRNSGEKPIVLHKIWYKDLIAVEGKQNYVMIHTTSDKIITYMTLTEMVKILKRHPGFAQFHRSFIISINHIRSIEGIRINMPMDLHFNVGDSYKYDFQKFVSTHSLKTDRGR